MQLEIVTPDKKIFSGDVKLVQVPGVSGSFEILNNHAPIISTLEKGNVILVDQGGTETVYEISGGVIEVKANRIILLADSVR